MPRDPSRIGLPSNPELGYTVGDVVDDFVTVGYHRPEDRLPGESVPKQTLRLYQDVPTHTEAHALALQFTQLVAGGALGRGEDVAFLAGQVGEFRLAVILAGMLGQAIDACEHVANVQGSDTGPGGWMLRNLIAKATTTLTTEGHLGEGDGRTGRATDDPA